MSPVSETPGTGHILRWLRRILFKHCGFYLRRRRIESLEGAALESLATDEETLFRKLERRDRMRLVGEAMHGLNQEEPTAIVLYYFNDYSYRQIEEFLEVSETTVNNRMHTGKKKLKTEILKWLRKIWNRSGLQGNQTSSRALFN